MSGLDMGSVNRTPLFNIFRLKFNQYFISPKQSRFEKFFQNLKSNPKRYLNKNSLEINLDNIIQGNDKRTSIIIKNVPVYIKKDDMKKLIEKYSNFNFIFFINNGKYNKTVVNNYDINWINYKRIEQLYLGLKNIFFNYNGKKEKLEMIYSQFQGKEELIKNLKDCNYNIQ